jgi:hypothetical protein
MSAAIALLCLGIAASAAMELELSKPLMSTATLLVLLAAYWLACRCVGNADSGYGTGKSGQAG